MEKSSRSIHMMPPFMAVTGVQRIGMYVVMKPFKISDRIDLSIVHTYLKNLGNMLHGRFVVFSKYPLSTTLMEVAHLL